MSEHLPTHLLVSALLRRINDGGGLAVVRARGDAQGGAILTVLLEAGGARILERGYDARGAPALTESVPIDSEESIETYWKRRRDRDPDLWVIELDGANAERLVAETLLPV